MSRTKQILIVGSGFAGMMAALAASRLRHQHGVSPCDVSITVVSPEPAMVIRPRLYERDPDTLVAPLTDLFAATDVSHYPGRVEAIDCDADTIRAVGPARTPVVLAFDRLVLASGSVGFQPAIPGLAEFGFSTTQLDDAVALDRHLHALAARPASLPRNTVVVCGAGFTGLEVATEMPARLRDIFGRDADVRVIVVEGSDKVAPAMGDQARPYILERLREAGVEVRLGSRVTQVDRDAVTLSNGDSIAASTVIWSAGFRASPLTCQLPGERDALGRMIVGPDLRLPRHAHVFAAGDTARAAADANGHFALMSCQHARPMGSFAGHNAAADLLGEPTLAYSQPDYVTCLDLGGDSAVFTRGWSPSTAVEITGCKAKSLKTEINRVWIYPPAADRALAYENALKARAS